jgi:hypothetical protein
VQAGRVPVGDDRVEGLPCRAGADHFACFVVTAERVGDVAVAVLVDREPFGVILLTVVVNQTNESVAPFGAQPPEHAADIDRTVLVGVTDSLAPALPT